LRLAGTTLDDAWDELGLPAPRLIKIDTEGAEQRVLEGMRGLLTRQDPQFVIAEYHPFGLERMGSSEESLRGFIEGLGYSTFALNNAGGLPRFVPPATRIQVTAIINMLFSKPDGSARAGRPSCWIRTTRASQAGHCFRDPNVRAGRRGAAPG
jgi:Methyltransferase FkbM domain